MPPCVVCAAASAATCPHCADEFCATHSVLHPATTPDVTGHMSCATLTVCNHCTQGFCRMHSYSAHSGAYAPDPLGDSCCAASLQPCTHCPQNFCGVHSLGTHQGTYQNDAAVHSCCAASQQQCAHCTQNFCAVHSLPGHQAAYLSDGAGHACCAASMVQCTHCQKGFCRTDSPHAEIDAATCNHKSCAPAAPVCAVPGCGKQYCEACKGATMVRDLCTGHLTASLTTATVSNIGVQYEKVPGFGNTVDRTISVDGRMRSLQVGGRGTPPPPLCSGKTDPAADIAELKQYDRGHLIALELDGEDDPMLIVPMIRQFNQSGAWRQMETSLGLLIRGTAINDVEGGTVPVASATARTTIDLSLRQPNVVNNTGWHIEIRLFYDDVRGDSRVPVWFYVRVLHNKKVWTHFSFANRCGRNATMPDETESVELHAAAAIYRGLTKTKRDQVVNAGLTDQYTDDPFAPLRPNQLLEFMRDVNVRASLANGSVIFTTMTVEDQGGSKPYTAFQRAILRKFNRWKNNGALRSDVQNDNVFPGEKKDAHAALDECGGRSAPEVDHIDPSYQGGGNYYINGRLVSFHHNHLYREKKTSGAKKVSDELLERYQIKDVVFMKASQIRYYDPGRLQEFLTQANILTGASITLSVADLAMTKSAPTILDDLFDDDVLFNGAGANRTYKVDSLASPYSADTVKPLLTARQTFLKAADVTAVKYVVEQALIPKYTASRNALDAAVDDVIQNVNNPVRGQVVTLILAAKMTDGTPLPLCAPSDRLKLAQAGEDGGVATAAFVGLTATQAQTKKVYIDLMARWEMVKP
jgi:hypothetical protein